MHRTRTDAFAQRYRFHRAFRCSDHPPHIAQLTRLVTRPPSPALQAPALRPSWRAIPAAMTADSTSRATRSCVTRVFPHFLLLLLAFGCQALLAAPKWPALDPAELAEKTPRVDPEAGAEILLREVTLDDTDES